MVEVTRRQVLTTTVGVTAAGVASVIGVGALHAGAGASASPARNRAIQLAASGSVEPVVVYVPQSSTGELRIMVGEREVQLHDPEMVGRLLSATSARG